MSIEITQKGTALKNESVKAICNFCFFFFCGGVVGGMHFANIANISFNFIRWLMQMSFKAWRLFYLIDKKLFVLPNNEHWHCSKINCKSIKTFSRFQNYCEFQLQIRPRPGPSNARHGQRDARHVRGRAASGGYSGDSLWRGGPSEGCETRLVALLRGIEVHLPANSRWQMDGWRWAQCWGKKSKTNNCQTEWKSGDMALLRIMHCATPKDILCLFFFQTAPVNQSFRPKNTFAYRLRRIFSHGVQIFRGPNVQCENFYRFKKSQFR